MAQVSRTAHEEGHHHIVPVKTLVIVFAALVCLTVLTYAASRVDLGHYNIPVALAIAIVKALLVVTFFMALKYDSPTNRLVFVMGLVFVAIFLSFTLLDMYFRGDVSNVDPETIRDMQLQEETVKARMPTAPAAPAVTDSSAGAAQTTAPHTAPAE
ncbi:MAG TPA: cytochrome C oxidase subunit IV family protein [Rhodothermales bacterium]|nr:cytochrome C oxidase subunit IV family protein [Rhodothermales bacterium]